MTGKPVVISAPHPRSLGLIFSPEALAELHRAYAVVEVEPAGIGSLDAETLGSARYLVGQPDLSDDLLARMSGLRAIFDVEGNFTDNMPYEACFGRGIHVLVTSAVFAEPVAEMGLGLALALARDIVSADDDFRAGRERWGLESNGSARLLSGSDIGIVGFGDLGRALHRLLHGFRATVRVFDPWLPRSVLLDQGVVPAGLDEVLRSSDTVFVTAAATAENRQLLGRTAFESMRPGASVVLLSRADIVDFPALVAAAASGRIRAATDVFPEEPPAADDPVRSAPGILRSAHRAGALDLAFKRMGDMVLEDMALMDRGLPPLRAKRAERETVRRMRSKPVAKS